MTIVYFIRHAQPDHSWTADDCTRPLTIEGQQDSKIVYEFLKDKNVDAFYCSPYKRSIDTIKDSAAFHKKEIIFDDRLRERKKGTDGNNYGMFQKRWVDKDFYEDRGESINMVQNRNILALEEIISKNEGSTIVVGTCHTLLNFNLIERQLINPNGISILHFIRKLLKLRRSIIWHRIMQKSILIIEI